MFNAIILALFILLAIFSIAVSKWVTLVILSLLFIFLVHKIFTNRCCLLIGENDCDTWQMVLNDTDDFWNDELHKFQNKQT
jgi:hypothetical protein